MYGGWGGLNCIITNVSNRSTKIVDFDLILFFPSLFSFLLYFYAYSYVSMLGKHSYSICVVYNVVQYSLSNVVYRYLEI